MEFDALGLPTYESAVRADPWAYIVPYIPRRELLLLARVSPRLRGRVQGLLWGQPRTYWCQDDTTVLDQFHDFYDAVEQSHNSRHAPSTFTHTLDLSNLGSETLTRRFPDGWLSTLLFRLPNLRSLVITDTRIVNHECFKVGQGRHTALRSLTLRNCVNVTARSLQTMLNAIPNLYSLDLSYSARLLSPDTCHAIAALPYLSILKLEGCGVDDLTVLNLTRSIIAVRAAGTTDSPQNLRSLDLRNNPVTGSSETVEALRLLGEALPSEEEPPPYDVDSLDDIDSGSHIRATSSGWSNFFDPRISSRVELGSFSDSLTFVVPQVRHNDFRSPVELGHLGQGLTHLYISDTQLSGSSATSLLKSLPLQHLDIGHGQHRSTDNSQSAVRALSALDLLEHLESAVTLRSLRASHEIVTGFAACTETDHITDSTVHGESQPYPYSWLRNQNTQYDPGILQGAVIKQYIFNPALLALDKITITNVPSALESSQLNDCLEAFLRAAADFERVYSDYGRRRAPQNLKQPGGLSEMNGIFLKEITIELATGQIQSDMYDKDTRAYEEASGEDFSFYPEEKKAYVSTTRVRSTTTPNTNGKSAKSIDVIARLSQFRQKQRLQAEEADTKLLSSQDRAWNGTINVIRNRPG